MDQNLSFHGVRPFETHTRSEVPPGHFVTESLLTAGAGAGPQPSSFPAPRLQLLTYARTRIVSTYTCMTLHQIALNSPGCKLGRPSSTHGSSADSAELQDTSRHGNAILAPARLVRWPRLTKEPWLTKEPLRVKLCKAPAGLN
eukprot:s50_g65.t1